MNAGTADDKTIDIEYTQIQRNSLEPSDSLYSVSSGSLPSHIRSISPKMDVEVTMMREQAKTSRCSSRLVYIILVAIFVISSSVAIAVAVHEIRKIQAAGRLQGYIQMHAVRTTTEAAFPSTTSDIKNVLDIESTPYTPPYSDQPTDQRTQCYKKCTMYGHTKFLSRCIGGYCECSGRHYQRKSCLPTVLGCVMKKQLSSKHAFLWKARATTYSCSMKNADVITTDDKNSADVKTTADKNNADVITTDDKNNADVKTTADKNNADVKTTADKNNADVITTDGKNNTDDKTTDDTRNIFIVSIYGNHFEKSTKVHVFNTISTNDSIIVVLASHYPVRWELKQLNVYISGIIMVSDGELSASQVEVSSQDGVVKPKVRHLFTPVGFGDDRHSYTVDMIQAVTRNVGPITKFLGSDFADNIFLDVAD